MAEAAIGKTGHAAAAISTIAMLLISSIDVNEENVAVATALPNTSCAHDTVAAAFTDTEFDIRRRSLLSRGRSIKRCGPRLTLWR